MNCPTRFDFIRQSVRSNLAGKGVSAKLWTNVKVSHGIGDTEPYEHSKGLVDGKSSGDLNS